MASKWFVMLNQCNGVPAPLTESDPYTEIEQIALYDSELEASKTAMQSSIGKSFGYETYEWPWTPKVEGE